MADALVFEMENGWRITHWLHENELSLQFRIADEQDDDDDFSFEGSISFDGCFNWRTDPNCYAHACEPDDLDRLKAAFVTIKQLASERVRGWCG